MDELSALEALPGYARPISLNMVGRVLEPYDGQLPKGVKIDALIDGYVRGALTDQQSRAVAPAVMRPLRIAASGTKRPQTLDQLAQATRLKREVIGGCLIRLEGKGLVRRFESGGETWEIAHDFIANLLGAILPTLKPPLLTRLRHPITIALLASWAGIGLGSFWFYPQWMAHEARRALFNIGATVTDEDGGTAVHLTDIDLSQNPPLGDYLKWLQPIRTLSIERNVDLADIDFVLPFTSLQSLTISNNERLTALPYLSGLDSLQGLAIWDNDALTALPDLDGLDNLKELMIWGNDALTNLPDLSGLDSLQSLTIWSNNTLSAIPDVSSLENLQQLSISRNNALTDIPDLFGLDSLQELVIRDNPALTALPGLSGLDSLQELMIWRNFALTAIPNLSGLDRLQVLTIADNLGLTDISSLSGLYNLQSLEIVGNAR